MSLEDFSNFGNFLIDIHLVGQIDTSSDFVVVTHLLYLTDAAIGYSVEW